MMGRNHLIAGTCTLEHVYAAGKLIEKFDFPPLIALRQITESYLGVKELVRTPVLMAVICLLAYFIGNLLPDVDNPKSILGKIIHVPVKHRRWFHAIYLYLPIAALGVVHPAFSWLFFGVFVHLFWDSFSAMGNCWFYKLLSDYKEYPSGAQIKKGHRLKLYHAGEWSEYLLVFVIVSVSVVSFVWIGKLG